MFFATSAPRPPTPISSTRAARNLQCYTTDISRHISKQTYITTSTTTLWLSGFCLGLPRWASTTKIKPIWIIGGRNSERYWHQLGHMQICILYQTDNQWTMPAPNHSVFTGRMPFLPPNQQRQSTEGTKQTYTNACKIYRSQSCARCYKPDKALNMQLLAEKNCLQCFDAAGWVAGRASGL